MYKLIAIDLDGTLFNSYGEISEENRKAIKYALNEGVEVVLASGREPRTMEKISLDLGIKNFLISGNGASVYSIKDKKNIFESYIDKENVLGIIDLCKNNSIFLNIYTNIGIIAEAFNYNVKVFNNENNYKPKDKQTNIEIVKDLNEYIKNTELQILKIIICDESKIIFDNIMQKLKKIKGIEVLEIEHMSKKIIKVGTDEETIEYYYTEITNKNTNKWDALEFIMNKLSIEREDVICIGDNFNDEKMIINAGVGVVMKESALALKKIGDYITNSNDEDGVKDAICKYIK